MIAVIFEVQPKPGRSEKYFEIAGALKSLVENSEGFISVERFESTALPGKYLSLSFWRDESAVRTWRNSLAHRSAQQRGREEIFTDYRLRIAEVVRDYGLHERGEAPADSNAAHRDKVPVE